MELERERVVLLHGLSRTRWSMARLAAALREAGYMVENWGYPSRSRGIADLVRQCRARCAALPGDARTHFVGHSLGGLIVRAALSNSFGGEPPASLRLGRIVLIGTPNRGALAVSRLQRKPLLRWLPGLLGRPAHELARDAVGLADLGCPATEIGIVFGTRRFHPLNPSAWINWLHHAQEPSDGTVECDSAALAGASDSVAVDAGHSFLPGDPRVIAAVLRFLKEGRF